MKEFPHLSVSGRYLMSIKHSSLFFWLLPCLWREFCTWSLAFSPSPLTAAPPLPSASRSHDWHPWPTGRPDFLAACMLPVPSTWTSDHWPHLSGWYSPEYPGSSIHFRPLNTIYNSNPWISLLSLNWSLEQWFSKRDRSLELPREFCRIWMPMAYPGSMKSRFLGNV